MPRSTASSGASSARPRPGRSRASRRRAGPGAAPARRSARSGRAPPTVPGPCASGTGPLGVDRRGGVPSEACEQHRCRTHALSNTLLIARTGGARKWCADAAAALRGRRYARARVRVVRLRVASGVRRPAGRDGCRERDARLLLRRRPVPRPRRRGRPRAGPRGRRRRPARRRWRVDPSGCRTRVGRRGASPRAARRRAPRRRGRRTRQHRHHEGIGRRGRARGRGDASSTTSRPAALDPDILVCRGRRRCGVRRHAHARRAAHDAARSAATTTSSPRSPTSSSPGSAVAREAGVAPGALAADPGIGFGKTVAHNLALLAALPTLAERTGFRSSSERRASRSCHGCSAATTRSTRATTRRSRPSSGPSTTVRASCGSTTHARRRARIRLLDVMEGCAA